MFVVVPSPQPLPWVLVVTLPLVLALGACAQSDPVTGGAGGGDGEGGFDEGEGGEQNHYEEAGPEVGSGAGDSTGSLGGSDGDPSSGGGGPGPATSSTSTGGDACDDGTCQVEFEDCETCPADCGTCGPTCGDGACDEAADETCDSCAEDCGACPTCGDDLCEEPAEDCDICFEDCGVCACEPDDFEVNNGSGSATPVALDTEYPDLSVCSGDVDWIEFSLNGTRTITITFNHAEGDLDLEIYSEATGGYVTGSYSDDDDETVVLSGEPSGTYWARVYGYMSATNPDYAIIVEQ